jgi:hypothetical protein
MIPPFGRESYVIAEDHTKGVGAIVTNQQALETVLRYFLAKMNNEDIQFPKVGDKLVNGLGPVAGRRGK